MKSDEQIKEWIDSKEALTLTELSQFLYGRTNSKAHDRVHRLWDYVLQTKDWDKLRRHREDRVYNGNRRKDENKIKQIIKKDERFKCGSRRAKKLLFDLYKINIARSVIANYLRELYAPKTIN